MARNRAESVLGMIFTHSAPIFSSVVWAFESLIFGGLAPMDGVSPHLGNLLSKNERGRADGICIEKEFEHVADTNHLRALWNR